MLITKDQFLHFVNRYKHCRDEQEALQSALRPFMESLVVTYLDKAIEAMEEMLVVLCECEEEDDIFFWWYDIGDKIIFAEKPGGYKVEYDCTTAEGLYAYLYDMYHHDY